MEFPSEIIRMVMENLNNKQKHSISRVCMLWRYLVATFKNIPRNLKEFKKNLKPKICLQIFQRTIFSYDIDYNKLIYLNLRGNSIKNEDAQYLAKSLETNSSLTYLNLCDNSIGNEGAQYLAKLLELNPNLKIKY